MHGVEPFSEWLVESKKVKKPYEGRVKSARKKGRRKAFYSVWCWTFLKFTVDKSTTADGKKRSAR